MFKRFLCVFLAGLMLLGMASAAPEEEIQFPLVNEPLTLRFMAPRPSDYANGYEDMKLLK